MSQVNLNGFPSTPGNGNGNGNWKQDANLAPVVREWAAQTDNPAEALRLYTFYRQELGLSDDDARTAAQDSLRISVEVEREFAA